ncbi:MAG TPA: hypothetical protein VN426_07180 [Syntrophomonadaceae bacterium]|nr:hypothetical protein [Syntrophomonadaceae bacterium]
MDTGLIKIILAIITIDKEKVLAGGCPVFLVKDGQEQQTISLYLARILGGVVHDLENGVFLVCRH